MNCHIPKLNNQLPVVTTHKADHLGKAGFDSVVVEEPLQITLNWQDKSEVFTITMRTPGDDIALAAGLLFCEGQIKQISNIAGFELEHNAQGELANHLIVTYHPGFAPDLAHMQRQLISQSSCGVCGKTSLKSLELKANNKLDTTPAWLERAQLSRLPDKLLQQQMLFQQTGGVHGAALFDKDYQLIDAKEDVGRHNALDKLIGEQMLNQRDSAAQQILVLSGRVSFELVQKAICAGYPVIVAVGAPSSLAINAAKRFDLTLIGFTKPDRFNVYHGQWRIKD